MILYFSGTGNSRHIANELATKTNAPNPIPSDQLISINQLLKKKSKAPIDCRNTPIIIVAPTYAWRLPRVVRDFISDTKFLNVKENKAYVVLTCGDDTAKAKNYCEKLCQQKGWVLQGFGEIVMPENYLAMYDTTPPDESKILIEKANPVIEEISQAIADGEKFSIVKPSGLIGKLKSGITNTAFYSMFVSAKGFHVTDKCNGCGRCAKLCPLNNVEMIRGDKSSSPKWHNHCTHCMACICGCPQEAVEYKNKSQNKLRYYLD